MPMCRRVNCSGIAVVSFGLVFGLLSPVSGANPKAAPAAAADEDLTPESIAKRLGELHPPVKSRNEGTLVFEPKSRVVSLETPILRRISPGTRWYRTELSTGYFEYPRAKLALAAWIDNGRLRIAECLSPTYADPSPEFLARFRALKVEKAADRESLAAEIAQIFAAITYEGGIEKGRMDGNRYEATLTHNGRGWRRVRVSFDTDGKVADVATTKELAEK
jgi:hypothetical protein